jgi:hypothetical protein
VLAASLHPPTAYSASGDPPSGSPAGAVYQLPLEQGRSDAAPKGGGGTAAGTAGADAVGGVAGGSGSASEPSPSGSLYRSENNFGSSSRVPGVAAGTGAADGAPGGSGGTAGGGAGAGAAGGAIAGGTIATQTSDNGNTSVAAGIVLIAAIALLATAVGVLSRRPRASRSS